VKIKLLSIFNYLINKLYSLLEIRAREEALIKKVLTVQSILGIIPQLIVVMGSIVTILLITLTGNSITYTQVGIALLFHTHTKCNTCMQFVFGRHSNIIQLLSTYKPLVLGIENYYYFAYLSIVL